MNKTKVNHWHKLEQRVLKVYPNANEDYVNILMQTLHDYPKMSVEEADKDYHDYICAIK